MGIEHAYRSINLAYKEWANHLGNPNFCRQGNELTWQKRQRIWLRNEFDSSAYLQLAEARQYSFVVVEDGGLIQLHYEFAGNELTSASAAYYGSSQITLIEPERSVTEALEQSEEASELAISLEGIARAPDDDINYAEDRPSVIPEEGAQLAEIVELIPSIRFDYSPSARRPYIHEHTHLHLPGFAQTRVAVCGFPSPQQFVELVFAWFYPEIYERRYEQFAAEQAPNSKTINHDIIEPIFSRHRSDGMRASFLQVLSKDHPHLPKFSF